MSTHHFHLFSDIDFGEFADSIKRNLASKIEKLEKRSFNTRTTEEIAEDFFREFSLKIPLLQSDNIYQRKPTTIKIDIDSEYSGKSYQKIEGTRFEIILPFIGPQDLFTVRPTSYNSNPPYGKVEHDGIHFVYEVETFYDNAMLRKDFDENLANINLWLKNLREDLQKFNIDLSLNIYTAVRQRKVKVSKNYQLMNTLGFPIR